MPLSNSSPSEPSSSGLLQSQFVRENSLNHVLLPSETPYRVLRPVPKIQKQIIEKYVEVPGERIEVPKIVTVEHKVPVPHYVDQEVPMIVSQTIKPVIHIGGSESQEVEVIEYEPEIILVEVKIPKLIRTKIIPTKVHKEQPTKVTVSAAQYNSMLKKINSHIPESQQPLVLPYIKDSTGGVPLLDESKFNVGEPCLVGDLMNLRHENGSQTIYDNKKTETSLEYS